MPIRIDVQESVEEEEKVLAVFPVRDVGRQAPRQRVEGPKHRDAPILAGCRNRQRFAAQTPHPTQAGMEMEFAFVLKGEGKALGGALDFFKSASRSRRIRLTLCRF